MKAHLTRTRGIVCVIALALLCLVTVISWNRRDLPRFHDRTVVEWLTRLDTGSGEDRAAAREAIRSLGIDALPTLQNYIQAKDPRWKVTLVPLSRKQPLAALHLKSAADRRRMGRKGFVVLGPLAVAPLIKLFEDPALLYADGNPAYEASRVLNDIGADAAPALIQALTNSSPAVRYHACFALGSYERLRSRSAVPALAERMGDSEWTVRCRAAIALGSIQLEPDISIQALVRGLRDPQSPVRYYSALGLAAFGRDAALALPELHSALEKERDFPEGRSEPGFIGSKSRDEVMSAIKRALSAIGPELSELDQTVEP